MLKQFILFAWNTYYPGGGMNDAISQHDTLEEATEAGKLYSPECGYGKWQVYNQHEAKVVACGDYDASQSTK